MKMKKKKKRRRMRPRTCWEEDLGQPYLRKEHEWGLLYTTLISGLACGSHVVIAWDFSSPEWDDCRRKAKSTSKRTGSSTQWGSQEAADWTKRRTADSEVRVCIGQWDCLGIMCDLQKFLKKTFLPTPEHANLMCPIKTHLWCLRNHIFGKWRSILIRNMRL